MQYPWLTPLNKRQHDEFVGLIQTIEIGAGIDQLFKSRRRDRNPGDDVADPSGLLVEVSDEFAAGADPSETATVLHMDCDRGTEECLPMRRCAN